MSEDTVRIVPGKSDVEVAAELRVRLEQVLAPVCALLDEADAAGFKVTFSLGMGGLKKTIIASLILSKQF